MDPINWDGKIYFILPEIALTHNLYIERLLASLYLPQLFSYVPQLLLAKFSLVYPLSMSLLPLDIMPFSERCSYPFSIYVHTNGHY